MEKFTPKTGKDYLRETEHAVRHFYGGIESSFDVYRQALTHWDISKAGRPLTPEESAGLKRYLGLAEKYFGLKFSEATFCGAILQVAAAGIRVFSKGTGIPESCRSIVPEKAKGARPFCVGEELFGLPKGLLVYAGRNQYNHWESDPFDITRKVFNRLTDAHYDNPFRDLAYDLGNPSITIYANEVLLGALRWYDYDTYFREMNELLWMDERPTEACTRLGEGAPSPSE